MHSIRARSTCAARSGRFGRNSCSGGSSSRIVTGSPFIASNRPSKSSCCSGSSSASASLRASRSSAMIIARIFGWRSSAMNMCSVRQRPMPSAPSSRALSASAGVSAFARTPRRRTSSAQPSTVSNAFRISSNAGSSVGSTSGTSSSVTSPLVPLMAMKSPAPITCSPTRITRSSRLILSSLAAVTHGTPMPRATSAAWLALPPRLVRMPLAAWKPATSLALVSGRTSTTARPSAAASTASWAVKTTSPLAPPGAAGDALGDDLVVGLGVEGLDQQRGEHLGLDGHQRLVALEQPFLDGVAREAHGGLGRPLGVARLEHVELPLLHRELGVLHVAVVLLERPQDVHQLLVGVGQPVLHLGDVARRARAGDDVLALGVGQEVAARLGRAGHLVAAEGDAGARRVALVAEDHLLDVDRRAPVVGDAVDLAVGLRAVAGPGVEDGADRQAQLLLRVLRELVARLVLVERLEAVDQLLERLDVELGVLLDAGVVLDVRDLLLERLAVDAAADVAEHLHEAPVGVPREALVVGGAGQALDRGVVEPQVEDRVEHPGHRFARAGAHGDQQRVLVVAELLARVLLQALERVGDLLGHPVGLLLAGLHVGHARLGRDREARRHAVGAEHAGHLRHVGALAAEQVAHVLRALGEVVDPLLAAMAQYTRCFCIETTKPWLERVLRQVMPVVREVQRRLPNFVVLP